MLPLFFQEGSKCSNGRIKVKSGEISKFQKGVRGGDFSKKEKISFFMKFLIFLIFLVFFQKCLEIPQKLPSNQSKPNNPFHEILSLI